ncbi:feruloyl-CoA synthase [compost metagenome]
MRSWFAAWLERLNRDAQGNASRIEWLSLLVEPPSIDAGEITDKGSINQRAVLQRRADKVEALYRGEDPTVLPAQARP